jgi:hypothetical protein
MASPSINQERGEGRADCEKTLQLGNSSAVDYLRRIIPSNRRGPE